MIFSNVCFVHDFNIKSEQNEKIGYINYDKIKIDYNINYFKRFLLD